MLFPEIRNSSARDSLIAMVRLSDILNTTLPGPSMMLRPASPKLEPAGFTQLMPGLQNAAVLNHSFALGLLSAIGWPGTMLARNEPLTPRLMSNAPPSTRGLK